jgi:PAS domain S-box-containing protein
MKSGQSDSDTLELRQQVADLRQALELERQRSHQRALSGPSELGDSEAALRRVNRQLRILSDCNQALIRTPDELEFLHSVCNIIVEVGGYRMAWVGFAETHSERFVRPVAYAGFEDGYVQNIHVTWSETESGQGPVGMAIRTSQPYPVQNIAVNPQFTPWRPAAMARGYASVCGLPLIAEGQTLGAVGIYSALPDAFDTEEVGLLAELADDLAFGIVVLRTRNEHRRAEQALIVSEERFKRLLQNSNDIIATLDENFVYTSVSGPVSNLLGYQPEELLGTSGFDSIHPEDIKAARTAFYDCFKRPDAVHRLEYRFRHKNGTWIYLEAVGTNRLQDTSVRGIVLNIRDMSDRKRGEIERDKLQNQLQQAMKMEAVGRLAGGIAHDFNNLLTIVTGNVELAKLTLNPSDAIVRHLDEVANASQSAASLTRQLLAFSRRQIIEPRVIDLNALVDNLQKMLVRLIGENIVLRTVLDKNCHSVFVDPGQFEQVLVNLVVNARDAMPAGGSLLIETANRELDQDYCVRHPSAQPGQYVMLAVSDTGHGMSEEVRLRLFEPFFTTKPKGQGTGLGLATIFGAVNQAGGSIEAYSELNQGSTFKIYLPRSGDLPEALAATGRSPVSPTGHETVLLVEDDQGVRDLTVRILRRLGYQVLIATNGSGALDVVDGFDGRIDLLMTDVVLPDTNGRELAERILAGRPETEVLFTSGYTNNVVVHRGIVDKSLNFIGKPYSLQALARKLREVLEANRG